MKVCMPRQHTFPSLTPDYVLSRDDLPPVAVAAYRGQLISREIAWEKERQSLIYISRALEPNTTMHFRPTVKAETDITWLLLRSIFFTE